MPLTFGNSAVQYRRLTAVFAKIEQSDLPVGEFLHDIVGRAEGVRRLLRVRIANIETIRLLADPLGDPEVCIVSSRVTHLRMPVLRADPS